MESVSVCSHFFHSVLLEEILDAGFTPIKNNNVANEGIEYSVFSHSGKKFAVMKQDADNFAILRCS